MKKKHKVISKEQAALLIALLMTDVVTNAPIKTTLLEKYGVIVTDEYEDDILYSKGPNFPKEIIGFTMLPMNKYH